MPQLAAAGYHVIAPDQRGYGRTTGWDADYDGDLASFRLLNLVRDALGLVSAFGYRSVDAVVGHDFGSSVAAWCALVRPDVFRSVVLMSAPFAGPPPLPFNTADAPQAPKPDDPVHRELAALPRPRKHYQWYYSTREANADMHRAPQGVHDFLRAYYHHKSADWKDNAPYPLKSWSAGELAKLPTYYVMDLAKDMAATVAEEMPDAASIAANTWLPERELSFYSAEYARTGFQGGLQWYRCGTSGAFTPELETFSGRSIDVPSCFISGKQDWGTYQRPGVYEAMQSRACTRMLGCHLIDGAGHWVQQEQPAEVSRLLLQFLRQTAEHAA
jgi:pimeloyl-ACP methyl ester carboxylesterase